MNLNRTQIVKGNFEWPKEEIMIKPTKHFLSQLKCRFIKNDLIPKKIKVEKGNIHSGKSKDGKRLNSVVVRCDYSDKEHLYICFNPYDGGGKSIWIKAKNEKSSRENSQ